MIGPGLKPANQNLSNLIDVAIDAPLIPDTNNLYDIGSNSLRWKDGYFSGMLTVDDLTVESGSSIKLAGATFENKGHYTSVDTNWMVEHDDQDTAFIGVYANSQGVLTHASLVLEAQGSALNLLKNSPLHSRNPDAGGIINEGDCETFVDHNSEISWQHFTELTKDEYGNITDLTDIQSLMRLTDDYLKLEDVGLLVNDIEIVNDNGVLQETDPIFSAWDKSVADLTGMSDERIAVGTAFGGLTDFANFTYDGNLTIGNGGIYLDRTGNDSFIVLSKDAVQQGQIRGGGNKIEITASGGSPTYLTVNTTTGQTAIASMAQISNILGDLKIQSDVQGDVVLFGDTDVVDIDNGKMLYVRRQAVEGNDYIRFYVSHNKAGIVSASSDLTAYAEDSVTLQSAGKDVICRVGDDIGAKKTYFKNSSNAIVGSVDSLGNAQFNVSMDVPEIYNNSGLLKIQPDVQGDVELFGDTDVDNAATGKIFKIWRRAAEGNDYIRFYIGANQTGFIHASCPLTLQSQVPFTINSVTDDIIFKVGDNAGAKKFYFQNSDNSDVVIIDSNGKSYFVGDMGLDILIPDEKLHIYDGKIRIEGASVDPSLFFTDNTDDDTWGFLLDRSEHDFHIVMRSAGRTPSHLDDMMTFTPTFYVGIKQSNPTCELDINGDLNVDGDITLIGTVDGINIAALSAAVDLKAPLNSPTFTGDVIMPGTGIWDSTGIAVGNVVDRRHELQIESTSPVIAMKDIDASSNTGVWHFHLTGDGTFEIDTKNDLHTAGYTAMRITRTSTTPQIISFPEGEVAVGTNISSGKLTVDQPYVSAAIPVLTLDQADVSEPWIEFLGGTISTGKNGQNEYLKVKVGGNTRYLRLFN